MSAAVGLLYATECPEPVVRLSCVLCYRVCWTVERYLVAAPAAVCQKCNERLHHTAVLLVD